MLIRSIQKSIYPLSIYAVLVGCIDRSLNPYDPDYPTDGYQIAVQWSAIDTSALRPMALYRVPLTLGKDSFEKLTATFSNPDILDTVLLIKDLPNNRLTLYFLSAGICTLTIDGLHPNGLHTSVTKALNVTNPYKISGDTLFGQGETGIFSLNPTPLVESTNLDLQSDWQLDAELVASLPVNDSLSVELSQRGRMKLYATMTDSLYDHSLTVDSLFINVPGYRPRLDSFQVITDTISPGEQPRIRIFADDGDSISLKVFVTSDKAGIWKDTFHLPGPLMYTSILTGKKSVRDTGITTFSVQITDSSGLFSPKAFGQFILKANPPVVRFNPDTSVIFLLPDVVQTLRVTGTADTFVWNIDGEDTVTQSNHLSRIFITQKKQIANASVFGIDRFGYRGPTADITIKEELSAYDLRFASDPEDSCHINGACWTAKTTRRDRVKEYGPLFYWEIMRSGDTSPIYRVTDIPDGDSASTLCLPSLSIPGISLDSIDCIVRVVLKDSIGPSHSSPERVDSVRVRRFRPVLAIQKILPRPDSVAVGQEMVVRFDAHDINPGGYVDSVFWCRSDSQGYHSVPVSDDTIALRWDVPSPVSLFLWTRDNDNEISDTVNSTFEVVKNRPLITGISMSRPIVYALERCTVSVAVESGILRTPVVTTLWHCDEGTPTDSVVQGKMLPLVFAAPGKKAVSVVAVDARGDSSLPFNSTLTIASGRPTVIVISSPDSVSIRVPAEIAFALSDLKSKIDTVFWRDTADSGMHSIAIPLPDSSFSLTWSKPGIKTIKLWAKDLLGDCSDTETVTIVVNPGRPRVTDIACDTSAGGIWVNDQIGFTVKASDTNGSVNYYRIVLKKQGNGDSLIAQGSSPRIPLIIPVGNEGMYTLIGYARDDDSLWSSPYQYPKPLMVHAGKPTVSSTSLPSTWLFDTVPLSVSAVDTNGRVQTLICAWADGLADTVAFDPPAQSVADTFYHRYTSHGVKLIRISATDDDGLVSVDTVRIEVKKGAPLVQAVVDTFVWYDNKGGIRGDTLNFKAIASDSNGTVSNLVWILRDPLDTTAHSPDTIVTTADSLVVGYNDLAFWAVHQTSRTFATDSTYTSAIYAVDNDGVASIPDTFRWYIDAPRSLNVAGEAKVGLPGDRRIFELIGGAADDDSMIIKIQELSGRDTNYLTIKIAMIIDSLTDFLKPATLYNDTISIGNDTGFIPIQRFRTKQNQSNIIFDSSANMWRLSYRPELAEFSPYKQTDIPTPWLLFRILVTLRTRSGAIQTQVSPIAMQMSNTLRFVP